MKRTEPRQSPETRLPIAFKPSVTAVFTAFPLSATTSWLLSEESESFSTGVRDSAPAFCSASEEMDSTSFSPMPPVSPT